MGAGAQRGLPVANSALSTMRMFMQVKALRLHSESSAVKSSAEAADQHKR